jgi:uncharacterized membrane protein YphA (DoxX/SURF4 family)
MQGACFADLWQRFFHCPESAESLGLFRMVWGGLLVLNGSLLLRDGIRFFGPCGLVDWVHFTRAFGRSRFTLFYWLPKTKAAVRLVIWAHIVASFALALGIYSRLSAAIAFVTLVSVHHRNPSVFHSGDSVMRLLTLLLVFSHAGDAYSLDCTFQKQYAAPVSSPWCLRLMQLQVCIVYLRAVWWKLQGRRWIDGTAAYYPTQLDIFRRARLPRILAQRGFIMVATYTVLVTEVALGTVIWIAECLYVVLTCGVILHVVCEIFLNVQLFGWVMLASYLLFVDNGHTRLMMGYVIGMGA